MGKLGDDDILVLPLDRLTLRWLLKLARCTGDDPAAMVLSMLRMIREDDEAAHETKH